MNGTIMQLQSESSTFQSLNIGKYYRLDSDLESHHIILLIQHAKNNTNLTELFIDSVNIDQPTAIELSSLIDAPPRKWKRVTFNFCHGEGLRILATPASIDCIRINQCRIGHEEFLALGFNLQHNKMLTKLEIVEEDFRGLDLGQALQDGLATTFSLKTLEFSHCRFDDSAVYHLAEGLGQNKSLVNFQTPGCELEDPQVALVMKSLLIHPTLRCLKICRNYCGEQGADAIASILAENDANEQSYLLSLNLSYQQFERAKRLDIGRISSSLVGNITLKDLTLSFNKLDDTDAEILALALRDNISLQKLDLRANKIKDAGAIAIAEHVVGHSGLKELFLFGNPFYKRGSAALYEAMRGNVQIEILNMDYNKSFYDSIQCLTYVNQAGRRIFKYNNFNSALWPLVLARTQIVSQRSRGVCTCEDIIFHLVRGPALLR